MKTFLKGALCAVTLSLWSCSDGHVDMGQGDGSGFELTKRLTFDHVRGFVGSAGGGSLLAGWVLVLTDVDTGESRVGEIDAAGLYNFRVVSMRHRWTLTLLTPDYTVKAVTTIPSGRTGTVHQVFRIRSANLPELVLDGQVLRFRDLSGIEVDRWLAADSNNDGVPDGAELLTDGEAPHMRGVDTDLDGTVNARDGDMDGDGVINWFDQDDDGDGIFDHQDEDANANLIMDADETGNMLKPYFAGAMRWLRVGTSTEGPLGPGLYLRFEARPSAVFSPSPIVRGPAALLAGAVRIDVDGQGRPVGIPWNRQLRDDDPHCGGSLGDGVFCALVRLAGDAPAIPQRTAVFFEIPHAAGPGLWQQSYPWLLEPAP